MRINWLLSKWIKHKKNQYCTFTYFIPPSPHIFSLLPPVTPPIVPLMSFLSLFSSKIHGEERKSSKRQGWLWAWCASGNTAQPLKDEEKRVCNLMVSYIVQHFRCFFDKSRQWHLCPFEYDTPVSSWHQRKKNSGSVLPPGLLWTQLLVQELINRYLKAVSFYWSWAKSCNKILRAFWGVLVSLGLSWLGKNWHGWSKC